MIEGNSHGALLYLFTHEMQHCAPCQGLATTTTQPSTGSGVPTTAPSSQRGNNESIVTNIAMRQERKQCRRITNEKLAAYRQSLSNSTAYAGHLSSLVFGKIKSLWSAQASTFNLGLNQLAGRTFFLNLQTFEELSVLRVRAFVGLL